MRCPRCGHEKLIPPEPCPECGFSGMLAQVEELAHVHFLLNEMAGWAELSPATRERLRARYLQRQRELEVALGLRLPPLSPEQARRALQEQWRLQQLLHLLDHWRKPGWVHADAADALTVRLRTRVEELHSRLAEPDTPATSAFDQPAERVALFRSLHSDLGQWRDEGVWVDDSAYQAALEDLEARAVQLEVELGLRVPPKRRRPEPVARPPSVKPPPVAPPREPLTWERVWRTMLSERTLHALLFVGVFLLFASAVTLVIYNWERFSPWVQVAFLGGFTLFFYGLGWTVRAGMKLRNSGLALIAAASLLVPVDFYAVYLSGGIFPRTAWAEVWLLASAVCLVAYTVTALTLRAEFFGYLVGVAAGSLLCATLQVTGVSTDWWGPALCGLSLVMILTPTFSLSGRGGAFSRPLHHLALLTVTVVVLLASGLQVAQEIARDSFRLALALDWWLACAVYVLGAIRYMRRTLTSAACVAAPVALYFTLAPTFEANGIKAAWHAPGWALLTPIYLVVGWRLRNLATQGLSDREQLDRASGARLSASPEACARIVVGWAAALILLAAAWAFGDMSAAAASHAVLMGSLVLAVVLWQRPRLLPFVSLFALSATVTWMSTLGLNLADYSLGLALLAILHFVVAIFLRRAERYMPFLYAAGFVAAGLALLPPLVALDRARIAYVLFNWIGLAGWGARLAHKEDAGLRRLLRPAGPLSRSILHWAAALPLPVWFWLVWTEARPADAWLGMGFAALAWTCLGMGRLLARHEKAYGLPWYTVSFLCSVVGPAVAGGYGDQLLLALALLAGAALYFLYAALFRWRWWLVPGGLMLPFGYVLALDHLGLAPDPLAASLALVPAAYLLVSIWLEQRRGVEARFMEPLYGVAHVVATAAFLGGLAGLADGTDTARLWAAAGQLVLGLAYGVMAWYREGEAWGHIAAWLGVCAGGLVAAVYSEGRGSSAAKMALVAIFYVTAERLVYVLRTRRAFAARAWAIYRRPLLVAGWAVSGGAVGLALVRNLWLLGGGPVRETWAIISLLMIVALYAVSARLFRRPLFLWLAAPLLFAPWTLLTYRGWYVWPAAPAAPRYALAWAALAWLLALVGLVLDAVLRSESVKQRSGVGLRLSASAYSLPLRTVAHVLLPFALAWGIADRLTSSVTWGLGVGFYVLAAVADRCRGRTGLAGARFLYPAALAAPVWAVYLLARFRPDLPHAHFGLLLLTLVLPAFAIARTLRRVDPADALPVYLASYGCALVGTLLVSYEPALLALALLFDAGLALLSAWRMREPLWVYPAAALPPGALLLALAVARFDLHRRGWWLIGLGAVYLAQAWALRRGKKRSNLEQGNHEGSGRYATPLMAAAYAIIALGLPLCSYEQTAAFWAYGGAALIYAVSAVWLRQPLLLTPTAALLTVPYAITIDRAWWLASADRGLAWWPGILVALVIAHLLDRFVGAPRDFPWSRPACWFPEAARRWTGWWGLPFYVWGYVGALASAALSSAVPARLAPALALAAAACGLAVWRFRLRGWLLIAVATAQAAWLAGINAAAHPAFGLPPLWIERLSEPAWQALAFLPATLAVAMAGLWVERRRGEGSPLPSLDGKAGATLRTLWTGWSRPFYALLALNLVAVQSVSLKNVHPGTWVSLVHTLLLFALAVLWAQPALPYVAAALGLIAVIKRLMWAMAPATDVPVALALLALGYGLVGYGLEYARSQGRLPELRQSQGLSLRVLERPLEWAGLLLSVVAIGILPLWAFPLFDWVVAALLGRPALTPEDVPVVQMSTTVLALAGLLYLGAALVRRWCRRGYGAVALLLCAWSLEWFLVRGLREVQWYAVPAGLYLLGVGYLEWRQARKGLARWIDRAALLLLLGTSFYQSLAQANGWPYALLMGAEGLLLIWWGSARRQRRFLTFGVLGVVLAVSGQLLRQLFTVANAWIAFGVVGLFVIVVAILIERNLKTVRRVSQEWRERLEKWE